MNKHPIDETTIETEFKRLVRVCSERRPPGEVQKQIPAFRRQAKDLAINRQLLLEEACRRKIDLSNEEMDIFLAQLPGQPSAETVVNKPPGKTSPDSDIIRAAIRNAGRIDKLVKTVIAAVPEPADDEVLKYLNESEFVPAAGKQNADLMQKIIDKTRRIVYRLCQNQALSDFIAELRKEADINES